MLIEKRLTSNAKNNDGDTPLHQAVQKKNTDIAKALINGGAKPDIQDEKGNTPLDLAPKESEVANILKKASVPPAQVQTPTSSGGTQGPTTPARAPAKQGLFMALGVAAVLAALLGGSYALYKTLTKKAPNEKNLKDKGAANDKEHATVHEASVYDF